VNVFAWADGVLIETATATGTPSTLDTVYLGAQNAVLDLQSVSVRSMGAHRKIGTANEDGTYSATFNALSTDTTSVTGDFELRYRFVNQHTPESTNYWDNWILREMSGTSTMLLRADSYALTPLGTVAFEQDWAWTDFTSLVSGAQVELAVRRSGTTVTCSTTIAGAGGRSGHALATQTGAPTSALSFGLTNEKSLIDLREIERVTHVGTDPATSISGSSPASRRPLLRVFTVRGALVVESDREGVSELRSPDGRTIRTLAFHAGSNRFEGIRSGLYMLDGRKVIVP